MRGTLAQPFEKRQTLGPRAAPAHRRRGWERARTARSCAVARARSRHDWTRQRDARKQRQQTLDCARSSVNVRCRCPQPRPACWRAPESSFCCGSPG
ncbi:hypothetical protein SALB1_0688 [Salinisphaera sp. LB1]|nr:hypothetical protein SALB1_0688 [Salinisphaera sp. LB1]